MLVEGEGRLALRGTGTDPTATSLRVSLGYAMGRAHWGWGQPPPRNGPARGPRLTSGPALRAARRERAAGGLHPSPAAAAVARRALDRGPGSGVRARPRAGLGPGRGWLGAAGAAASRDWERGRSKNVSYSSVFLPGPAPPLPPNKPFPIAQLADGRPLDPRQGSGPDPPLRGCRSRGRHPPRLPPPGIKAALPPPASHIRLPEGAGLGLGPRGSRGVQAQSRGSQCWDARHRTRAGRGRGGGGGAPPRSEPLRGGLESWTGRGHRGNDMRGGQNGEKLPVFSPKTPAPPSRRLRSKGRLWGWLDAKYFGSARPPSGTPPSVQILQPPPSAPSPPSAASHYSALSAG